MQVPRNDRPAASPPWWHDAVGYQVYVRSFADSDGDGLGDLAGVRSRLDHLEWLGVDVVWITPVYPSPMIDMGYDVAHHCAIDPRYGTLDDFDALVTDVHRRGMRLIVDIVPNHTSNRHEWFQAALADPDDPRHAYYVWADPAPDGGPPNNWVSYFGGPAWTLDKTSGRYHLHLFLPEQPDLDWRNPDVRREFDAILEFWLDRGVDGFRFDVAQALVKDDRLRSNPQVAPWDPEASRSDQWAAFDHRYDILQPETLDLAFRRWRELIGDRDVLLLGETYVPEAGQLARLLPGDGLHAGFWFGPMHIDWDAASLRRTLRAPLDAVAGSVSIGWVAASHDEVRPPSRLGGGDRGRSRSLALSTLLLTLPGLPFLYQGEELGLLEGDIGQHPNADPLASANRDGCRTPMPWAPGTAFGFSSTSDTWLPDGGRSDTDTVAWQRDHEDSWLHRYRELVAVRHQAADLRGNEIDWIDLGADVVAFSRGGLRVMVNAGDQPVSGIVDGDVVFASSGRAPGPVDDPDLHPDEAVIVRRTL